MMELRPQMKRIEWDFSPFRADAKVIIADNAVWSPVIKYFGDTPAGGGQGTTSEYFAPTLTPPVLHSNVVKYENG